LRTASAGFVRGRNGRLIRSRKARGPSYQLHPDPERYQQIQQALRDRGYFNGAVNGQWGDDSTDALKRFQAGQKLPDDGKISALTLTALGLGPRHDGSSASAMPLAAMPSAVPISGPSVGAGATIAPERTSPSTTPPTEAVAGESSHPPLH
jgi:peptidoglycan lytic transglycosylase